MRQGGGGSISWRTNYIKSYTKLSGHFEGKVSVTGKEIWGGGKKKIFQKIDANLLLKIGKGPFDIVEGNAVKNQESPSCVAAP